MTEKKSKQLYKSTTNHNITGVIGGIGEYFNIDPTVLRVGYVLVTVFSGFVPGIIGYITMVVIIPNR